MRTTPRLPLHSSPAALLPGRRRRLKQALVGGAVTAAIAASGVVVASANAEEGAGPSRVQAESYAAHSGAQVESTEDIGGGHNVGWLANGDWLRLDNVDLGAAGPLTIGARIASDSAAGGTLEIRIGALTGELLAAVPVASTGGWQQWTTVTATAASHPAGRQSVFVLPKSGQPDNIVNLNWLTFDAGAANPSTPGPSGSAPAPGWVKADRAAWEAQLAEFAALTPKAVPGGNVRVPEFNAGCTISHRLPDDPIVFPGMAGASHGHTFWGNRSTDAHSTNESLMAKTASTCTPAEDHSAYWVPSLLQDGKVLDPHGVIVYYGSRLKDPGDTVPFPAGFRMIAGDAKKQADTPDGAPAQFWCAGVGGQIGRSADGNWPVCAKTAEITFQLTFPDCWDGVHLDSPDHKSHVGPAGPDGTCKSGAFPVTIPSLSFVIGYPTSGGSTGFALTSGKPSSMHGDFMNAWETRPLAQRVRDCITQRAKCDSAGNF